MGSVSSPIGGVGLAYYLLTGRAPQDGSDNSLLDTVSGEDAILPVFAKNPGAWKLAKVAELALKKAVDCRPQSAEVLLKIRSGSVDND